MDRLKDLLTILYRPRETMRAILDRPDRWSVQVVLLAYFCSCVSDTDIRDTGRMLSNLKLLPMTAIITLVLIAVAAVWVLILYLLSWIATPIGRILGGTGPVADVRAALAWAMVPVIWSVIYRIPLAILQRRIQIQPKPNVHDVLLRFVEHGGCSFLVILLALEFLFFLWCIFVASCTVAEAQRFSIQKGFVNVVITLALPVMVIAAAMFSLRGSTG